MALLEAAAQIAGAELGGQPVQDCPWLGQRCVATPVPNLSAMFASEDYVPMTITSQGKPSDGAGTLASAMLARCGGQCPHAVPKLP